MMSSEKDSPETRADNDGSVSEGLAYYELTLGGTEIIVPAEVDTVDLINTIVELDSAAIQDFNNLPEPERFETDFETRQRYLAETARYAGMREGFSKVIASLVQNEETKDTPD